MTNQVPRDANNVPALLGYDPTGHQIAVLQVASVSTDATSGTVSGSLQVAGQGAAGTPAGGVISIQGVSGGTVVPVSGTVTATNPSVGTDSSALPSSSTLIGASDGTNLQPLLVESASNRNLRTGIYQAGNEAAVTGANALKVDNSAVTQPVSGTITVNAGTNLNTSALALETGGNLATLAAIVSSNKAAVKAAANDIADLGTLAGAIASAIMQSNTKQINGVTPLMGNGVTGTGSQRVTIASDNTAFPVSATIQTNAAINNAQVGGNTTSVNNGTTDTGTQRVTLSSDSTGQVKLATGANTVGAVTQGSGAAAGTSWRIQGDFTEQALLSAGSLNADLVPSTDVSAYKWLSIHINTNAYSGTLSFQGSNDNSNWLNVLGTSPNSGGITSTTSSTNILYSIPVVFRYFRIRMTSYTSGTAQGTLELYTTPSALPSAQAVQNGTWTVQPGNTPNTTAWLAMPSGATSAVIAAGAAGPTVIKASAGIFYGALITSVGAGAPLGYDNASAASGSILSAMAASAAVGTRDTPPSVGSKFANGLTFAGGATMPAMTIFYS